MWAKLLKSICDFFGPRVTVHVACYLVQSTLQNLSKFEQRIPRCLHEELPGTLGELLETLQEGQPLHLPPRGAKEHYFEKICSILSISDILLGVAACLAKLTRSGSWLPLATILVFARNGGIPLFLSLAHLSWWNHSFSCLWIAQYFLSFFWWNRPKWPPLQRSLPPLFASIWWILKCTTKAETKCPSHLLLNSLFLFPSQMPCLGHVFPFFIRTWQSTFLNIYWLSQIGDVHLVKEVAKCWKRIFLAAIPSFINFFNSIIIRLKGWRYHVRSVPQLGDTIPRYFKMKTLLVGLGHQSKDLQKWALHYEHLWSYATWLRM